MKKETALLQLHWKTVSRFPDFIWIKKLTAEHPDAEIFLVGGAVRDILLKEDYIRDYDFVVRNITQKKLEIFLKKNGTVNLVGKTFGVYKFTCPNAKLPETIDIAFPRTETKIGVQGKYRDFKIDVDPHTSIEEDLARRDFTINAIAWNIITKELVDPYNGILDLKTKTINTVGIPKRRFEEDYNRILRALRFSIHLNFSITPRVQRILKSLVAKLNAKSKNEYIVPREVIAKEIIKTFNANPVRAFDAYDSFGVFKILIPELLTMKKCPQPKEFHTEGDVWAHTRLALTKVGDARFKKLFPSKKITPLLIFATLFHDIGKPSTLQTPKKDGVDRVRNNNHDHEGGKMVIEICNRLKFSSYGESGIDCESLSWLIRKHLLLVHGPIENIKNSTIEKYFFNENVPGSTLQQLFYTDGAATIPKAGNNLNALKALLKRVKKLEPLIKTQKNTRKRGLINGTDLIKELKLKEGPHIGKLLLQVREAELSGTITTKQQAINLAMKINKK